MVQDKPAFDELEKKISFLSAQLDQRSEELAVINAVQEGLAKKMDMQAIYDLVGERIRETFDAQAVIIATFDHEAGTENFCYVIEKGERFHLAPRQFDKLRQTLIDTRQKILINENFEEAYRQFGMRVLPGSEFPKSALFVPLIIGEKVTGYVSLQNVDKTNAFVDSDARLLDTLANSMSAALENAHLLKETEQRTAELAVINSVQEALAKEMDIQAIYDLVGNRIRELFDAQAVGIATFDHATETEHIHYLIEKGERYYPAPRPLNILRKHLIATREKILINKNFDEVAATFGVKIVPGTEQPKSALYVPLVIGDRVTGYMSLQNVDKENAFTEADVRLLETLANSMGVALENARLFDETNRLLKETEQQKAELGVINSVQEGLAKELDIQAIYDLVGNRIRELFKAQAVIIATFDHDTATEHFKYALEDGQRFDLAPRPYDKLRQHLIITRHKIVINTNYAEAYAKFGLKTLPGTNMTKSGVFVPLVIGDKVNSYISLQNNETENAFSESDVRLLETLANSMSVALENARLFDETNRLLKETEQGKAELAVINSVQEGLARELDINGIYQLVGDRIQKLFSAQVVVIATFDRDKKFEHFNYHFEKGEISFPDPRPYDKVRKHLIETGQNILINEDVLKAVAEFGMRVVPGTEMPKSLLFMPMKVGDRVTGYISLQNIDKENAFSFSDVRLLSTLANSMSVALENARLFDETNRLLKETEQRNAELAVINSVQESLVAKMDMDAIYELVGEKMREIFNPQVIDIVTYDSTTGQVEDKYAYEKGDRTKLGPRDAKGFRKHVIETGQVLMQNTGVEKALKDFGNEILHGDVPKSQVYVPMIAGGKVTGVISLQNLDHENAFSESDVSLLTTLANSMSVALESARLFDETNRLLKETEQRTAELAIINSVQEGLASKLDIQSIYDLVGDKIREVFDAQGVAISYLDRSTNRLHHPYYVFKGQPVAIDPIEFGKGISSNIIKTGQAILINENAVERMRQLGTVYVEGETDEDTCKSWLGIPLISGGVVNGTIKLENYEREHAYTDSDVSLLQTLGNSISVALENARLFDETNRLLKETEQRTAELAVINSVQEGLARELDMNAIYSLVGDRLCNLFPDTQTLVIRTFDHDNGLEHIQYFIEKGERFNVEPRPVMWANKQLVAHKKVLYIDQDYMETAKKFGGSGVTKGMPPKSAVFVPMVVGDVVKGSISLQNIDRENAFSESDIRLLTTVTNSMSVALENARLFDETNRLLKETEQRNAELAVINSVQESLVAQINMDAIYELVGEKIREIFNAQAIDIATYDRTRNLIEDKYGFEKGDRSKLGLRQPKGFRKYVIENKQMLVINSDVEGAREKYGNVVITGEPAKSLVIVPLIAAGDVTGVITLQNLEREHAFSESDISLISTLANSMSVALESARLFDETNRLLKETEQRTAELAVINSVQEGLAKELDMHGIYELVGDRLCELFPDSQTLVIRTFDYESGSEHWQYAKEKGERQYVDPRPFNWNSQLLIKTKKPLDIRKDYVKTSKQHGGSGVTAGQPPKSAVFVPMLVGDVVKGSVSLQNVDQENAFSDSDLRLLTTITNSMSVALENARLFDETHRLLKETEQRTAELGIINGVQEGLASKLDVHSIYELVGDKIRDVFDTQGIAISHYDHKTNMISHPYYLFKGERLYGQDFELGKGLASQIIKTGQPLLINTNAYERFKELGAIFAASENPDDTAKSWLGVPVTTGGQVTGTIRLENYDHEFAYSDSDVSLLQTLASSMSVALENARLFDETNRLLKETEQRTGELAVINSVQEGLVREMDMDAIYETVGERLCSLFNIQTVVIRTFNHETGMEEWQYAKEKGERQYVPPRPFNWNSKVMIESKRPLAIPENYIEIAKSYGSPGVTAGQPPKSAVFVPMIVGDVVKGSVSLQNVDREHAFSDSDIRLLTTLTNSMSVALENARLFDETARLLSEAKQRANELTTVNAISKALASQLDADELIHFVGDQMKDLFRANIVYLALLNTRTQMIDFAYQYGEDMPSRLIGEGVTSQILLTGEPLLINEDVEEKTEQMGMKIMGAPAASYLGVPIPVGEQILGVLSVQSTEQENRFTDNDLRLLSTIAASVGVALKNATLFEEVKQAKHEAEQASKAAEKANEAKSAFLSTVSHELRTPLTSVLGFAKIIRKRLDDKIFPAVDKSDPKTQKTINQISENLNVVVSEGERLTHLINEVLDLAKIEAGKMEWNVEDVSLTEVAERAISATTALFEQKSLSLDKEIEKDLPTIQGDRDKLIQVMINLISNAVKFTNKGRVSCKIYRKKKELVVSVTDTGIGIAPEDFGAVFEQFKQVGGDTLTDKPKGTGLGLPICKEIVEHHGGRIWLESEVGKGSTFYFALPFVRKDVPKKPVDLNKLVEQLKEQISQSALDGIAKTSTILIVDDDDSIRSLLHQELSDAGYMIEEAPNGKAALESVRKNKPDLIILDIMMPEMNGFDVAAVLKNDPDTQDIPIIVLSIVQDKARGYRIGVDRYLTKPIDTALLFTEVGALLEQGKSKKKVMVVDEDAAAVRTLADVLEAKGYHVVESDGKKLLQEAVAAQPDIILFNSMKGDQQDVMQTLRFEKGMENVLFLLYQ